MTHEPDADPSQPVFHGAAAKPVVPDEGEKSNRKFVAGVAFGIGSAAVVAALLYARHGKAKTQPPRSPEPSD